MNLLYCGSNKVKVMACNIHVLRCYTLACVHPGIRTQKALKAVVVNDDTMGNSEGESLL